MTERMRTRLQLMRAQLYAQGDITPEFNSYRSRHRLDLPTIQAHAGIIAVTLTSSYSADNGSIFEFDAGGLPAAVIEANTFDNRREPFVADLVAWPLHDPHAFATALGPNSGADVLGAVHMVQRGNESLRVHRTPLDWLKAGCQGCVLLSELGGAYWLRKAGGIIIAEDVDHGRELRAMLGARVAGAQVLVPWQCRNEVAA